MGRHHHHHHHNQHEKDSLLSPPSPEQQKLRESLAHAFAESKPLDVAIIGAGIVGLTMALALEKYCPNLKIEIYEQAPSFKDGVGAGIGMYPNGLRVLQDISKSLVQKIQHYGYPYLYRRWEVSWMHLGRSMRFFIDRFSKACLNILGLHFWLLSFSLSLMLETRWHRNCCF